MEIDFSKVVGTMVDTVRYMSLRKMCFDCFAVSFVCVVHFLTGCCICASQGTSGL